MNITPKKTDPVQEAPTAPNETGLGEEESTLDPIDALREQYENAPSREVIEGWKTTFGSVAAFAPSADDLFLFRPLRRMEHRQITRDLRAFSESNAAKADPSIVEDQLHEKVITSCLLFPKPDQDMFAFSEAGLMPTLFGLIMETSMFISPEQALRSTFKL